MDSAASTVYIILSLVDEPPAKVFVSAVTQAPSATKGEWVSFHCAHTYELSAAEESQVMQTGNIFRIPGRRIEPQANPVVILQANPEYYKVKIEIPVRIWATVYQQISLSELAEAQATKGEPPNHDGVSAKSYSTGRMHHARRSEMNGLIGCALRLAAQSLPFPRHQCLAWPCIGVLLAHPSSV